ncbi:MAG: hypothetical protein AB7N76_05165 [Planctomycetota bacterium]
MSDSDDPIHQAIRNMASGPVDRAAEHGPSQPVAEARAAAIDAVVERVVGAHPDLVTGYCRDQLALISWRQAARPAVAEALRDLGLEWLGIEAALAQFQAVCAAEEERRRQERRDDRKRRRKKKDRKRRLDLLGVQYDMTYEQVRQLGRNPEEARARIEQQRRRQRDLDAAQRAHDLALQEARSHHEAAAHSRKLAIRAADAQQRHYDLMARYWPLVRHGGAAVAGIAAGAGVAQRHGLLLSVGAALAAFLGAELLAAWVEPYVLSEPAAPAQLAAGVLGTVAPSLAPVARGMAARAEATQAAADGHYSPWVCPTPSPSAAPLKTFVPSLRVHRGGKRSA